MKGQKPETRASDAVPAKARVRRPWRKLFWCAGGAALAFVVGFGVFSNHVGRLSAPSVQGDADAIIVLTGGQSRLDAAVDLLRSGKAKRLLISGVNPVASPEDIQRISGADEKLFRCCIDIDRVAADTVGNAMESAKWMQQHAYGSAILVTNNYHMPRSLLEMRRFGAGSEILPHPVVNTRIDRGEWLLNPDALRVLFTEYTKYLAAMARNLVDGGGLQPPTPVDTASAL